MEFDKSRSKTLIIGSGIAGLTAALKFSQNADVTILTKSNASEGSTRYAQGGIASVWSKSDSFDEHISDTLQAGAGLCHKDIVSLCVHEGPTRIKELIDWGVQFTKAEGDPVEVFDLHREGGHGKRRILHADDLTGAEIERALLEAVKKNANINLLENSVAVDLITENKALKIGPTKNRVLGAYVLDQLTHQIHTYPADLVILATGGAGRVYLYTTNPEVSTGDGIALAHRAGARVANLEFIQFHPTCLYHPQGSNFLISEALRGEGALLRTVSGYQDFMPKHHPMGSLAPRDIVARSIDLEMKRTGDKHVWLDATSLSKEELLKKFPNIFEKCLSIGIDISKQPIPVVPAAHYTCGGVLADQNGQTSVPGLYAIGEVACSGLHGANRLASNSLLEAVVFAHKAYVHALPLLLDPQNKLHTSPLPKIPDWDKGRAAPLEDRLDIAASWHEIRTLMWNYVGIVRSNRRLERALRRIELIKTEVNAYYWSTLLTKDLIELRNILIVAELIVLSAMQRKESRGLHFTVDYPERDDRAFGHDTII